MVKGTYIRTLATDIGLKLGFPAHMSRLTRIASGGFQLESSLTIDQIKELHEHDSLHNELFYRIWLKRSEIIPSERFKF